MKNFVISAILLLVVQKIHGNPGNGQQRDATEQAETREESEFLTKRVPEGSSKSDSLRQSPIGEFQIGYGGGYVRKSKDERSGLPSLQNPQVDESVLSPYGGDIHETLGPLGLYGAPGPHSPVRAVAEINKHQLHADIHGKQILNEALHQKQKLNAAILESQRHNAAVLDKQLLKADLLEKERLNTQLLDKELYETEVLTKQRLHEAIRDKQRLAAAIFEKERLSEAIREKQRVNAAILEKGKVEAALVEKQLLEAAYVNKERLNQALFEKQRLAAAIAEKERLIEDIMSKQQLNAAIYNKQTLHSAGLDKEIGKSLAAIRANEELSHLAKEKLVGTVGSLLHGKPNGYGNHLSPLGLSPLGPGGVFKAAGPPYGASDALLPANKHVGIYGSLGGSVGVGSLYPGHLGNLGAVKALAAPVSFGGAALAGAGLVKTANPLFNFGHLGPKPLLPNYGYGSPLVSKPLSPLAGPGFADYYDYNVAPVHPPKPPTVTVITPVYDRPGGYPKQPLQTVVVKDKLPPGGPYGYEHGYNSPFQSAGHYFSDKSTVGHEASGPAPVVVHHNGGPVGPQPAASKPQGQIAPNHFHDQPNSYSYTMMPGSFDQDHNQEGPSILGRVDKLITSKALGTAYSLIGKALSIANN